MQILSVELENIKSFERATISFTPGVNAIVGHNGAGKSTILEAIGFVLFGSLDYSQASFIRAGATYGAASVTFVSSADERAYTVVRRIGKGPAYYVHDPEMEERCCDGAADVDRFLRQHMGIEAGLTREALFRDAVGVPQGMLTAAFALSPANRKGVFDPLLRVDEYDKAWERLLPAVNLLKERRNEAGFEIRRLEEELARRPELEAAVSAATAVLEQAEARLLAVKQELETVQAQRRALEATQAEVLAAERNLAQANQKLQGSRARALAAQQALTDAQAAQVAVAQHQAGHDAYVAAQAHQATLDAQVRQRQQVEARRAEAERTHALLVAKLERLTTDLAQAQAAAKTVAELAPSVQRQEELEASLGEAQRRQARWEEAQRRLAQQQAQVETLTQRRAKIESEVHQASAIESELATLAAEIEAETARIQTRRNELAGFKTRADLIKEQSATLARLETAICPVCEQPLTADHRHALLARNETQLTQMRNEYRALHAAIEQEDKANAQRRTQQQTLQKTLRGLARSQDLELVMAELAAAQTALAEAQAQVAELGAATAQIAELQAALKALGDPRRARDVAAAQAATAGALMRERDQVRAQVEQAAAAVAQQVEAARAFADLDRRLEENAALLAQHRAAYQTVLANRRQAEELPQRAAAAQEASREAEALTAQVEALTAAHAAAAARFDEAEYRRTGAREQALQQESGSVTAQVEHSRREKARAENDLMKLAALAELLEKQKAKLSRLEWESAALEMTRTLIRQAGPYIADTLSRQISEGAAQIFGDLMQDYSRRLIWNKDYGITLEVGGHERTFQQLSGGEQMSAALAVRLALLREMSSIDIAFFDEPTANLDEARREALARQILQVRGFSQLFVISHDDTFEQATQNLVRVARINGTSVVGYGA